MTFVKYSMTTVKIDFYECILEKKKGEPQLPK